MIFILINKLYNASNRCGRRDADVTSFVAVNKKNIYFQELHLVAPNVDGL